MNTKPSATEGDASPIPGGASAWTRSLRARWRGEAPLARVFWVDMLLTGTIVNALATILAACLLSAGVPTPLVGIAYFAPLPLNIFLVVALWRSAAAAEGMTATAARVAAVAWLLAATAL